MATCPNCGVTVQVDALECPDCPAVYGRGWLPIAESDEETLALSQRDLAAPAKAEPDPPLRKRTVRPSSKSIALLALLVWVSSLTLTGLAVYGQPGWFRGLEILLTGWFALVALNFAWFANPLFLFAFLRVISGRSAALSVSLALLLALDTFRLSTLNEAGGPIYGYGWGFVLWYLSFCLMLVASGIRDVEYGSGAHPGQLQRFLGVASVLITLTAAGYWGVQDRTNANDDELRRLAPIVFKRGTVCGANEPVVSEPVRDFSGVLELHMRKDALEAKYPFSAKTMLEWGIPVVRVSGIDYSYAKGDDPTRIASAVASGTAAAALVISERSVKGRREIGARLVETAADRTVFNQTWTEETPGGKYCPEYHAFPSADHHPRKLVITALGLTRR